MNNEQMIQEAKALWHSSLGAESCPGYAQYRRWVSSCGLPSVLYAIAIVEWKRRTVAMMNEVPLTTLGLWKYCSSVAKRHSIELGYERPVFEYRNAEDCTEKQTDFSAPAEWLQV